LPDPIRWTEVKVAMLMYVPFFASLLLDLLIVKIGKFPEIFGSLKATAATDGRTVWLDEDFLASLTLPKAVFLMCHEIGHVMWEHMARGKMYQDTGLDGEPFDSRLWNQAGDYVINDMLIVSGIGEMPKEGLHNPKLIDHTMSCEDAYRALRDKKKQQQQQQQQKQQQPGKPGNNPGQQPAPPEPDANGNAGDTLDTHILKPAEIPEQELRRAVKSAVEAAKAQGAMPGALDRFVDELLTPKVPWAEKLRFHVQRNAGREGKTWSRPHRRRFVLQGIIMPSSTGFKAGIIVVVFDTSGSIGDVILQRFMGELSGILDDCKPEKIYVLSCDAAVHDVTEIEEGHDLVNHPPKTGGGGGTDFRPPFEWVYEEGIEPATLIYFTDMYGTFPNEAPDYPVIWAATTDKAAPWGEYIHIDAEEE